MSIEIALRALEEKLEPLERVIRLFTASCNSQGGMSLKYHSVVEFAFDERILGDLGLRL